MIAVETQPTLLLPAFPGSTGDAGGRTRGVGWDDPALAAYMGLDRKPVTAEARSLCALATRAIENWERRSGTRKRSRRNEKLKAFRHAVAAVTGDLLSAADTDPCRWLFRSVSPNDFTGGAVSHRTFGRIVEAMRALDLIEVRRGYYSRDEETWRHGRSTRFRSTSVLLDLAAACGIALGEAGRHFGQMLPRHPLVLKASSKRRNQHKLAGRSRRFEATEQTRRLEGEVHELNEFIAGHDLQGGTSWGYRRIFNCGDLPGFAWDKGGRLYSQGEESYQRLSKEERLGMRIEGEPVAEIDITASFLTILYARRGLALDASRDPYGIPGVPRKVVKAWVTMTLGHHAFHRRWPSEIAARFLEEHGQKLGVAHPIRAVQRAVLAAHPVLADWPEQEMTCFDLMFVESEAIVATMLRLKREMGIVSLSVHDSLIVPWRHRDVAIAMLKEEYQRVVGVEPALRVHVSGAEIANDLAAAAVAQRAA
jgi:hypothetical protein